MRPPTPPSSPAAPAGRPLARAVAVTLAATAALVVADARGQSPDAPTDKQQCIEAHTRSQQLRNDKKLVAAKEQLLLCAREACPALVRQACSDLLSTVLTEMPTIAVSIQDGAGRSVVDATVTMDGAPWPHLGTARDVDPGVHEVGVSHPIHGDAKRVVTVIEGKKSQSVTIELGAPAKRPESVKDGEPGPRSYVPPAGAFVFFGLSIAGTGAGATLAGLTLQKASEASDCAGDDGVVKGAEEEACFTPAADKKETFELGSQISFAISGAFLASGLIWWIVDAAVEPAIQPAGRSSLRPVLGAGPGGASVGRRSAF